MRVTFASSEQQLQPWEYFTEVFDAIYAPSEGISKSLRDGRRIMNPHGYNSWDQRIFETVVFSRQASSEEFEDYPVGQKSNDFGQFTMRDPQPAT